MIEGSSSLDLLCYCTLLDYHAISRRGDSTRKRWHKKGIATRDRARSKRERDKRYASVRFSRYFCVLYARKVQQMLAVDDKVDKVSPVDAGRRRRCRRSKSSGRWRSTSEVDDDKSSKRMLAVNDEVDE